MKLINSEEKEAHINHLVIEGGKGFIFGSFFSLGLFNYLKVMQPAKFRTFSPSIKACIFIMPTISIMAYFADSGSITFDKKMYAYDQKDTLLEKFREWKKMTAFQKTSHFVSDNKAATYIGSLECALVGAWLYSKSVSGATAAQQVRTFKTAAIGASSVLTVAFFSATYLFKRKTSSQETKSEMSSP